MKKFNLINLSKINSENESNDDNVYCYVVYYKSDLFYNHHDINHIRKMSRKKAIIFNNYEEAKDYYKAAIDEVGYYKTIDEVAINLKELNKVDNHYHNNFTDFLKSDFLTTNILYNYNSYNNEFKKEFDKLNEYEDKHNLKPDDAIVFRTNNLNYYADEYKGKSLKGEIIIKDGFFEFEHDMYEIDLFTQIYTFSRACVHISMDEFLNENCLDIIIQKHHATGQVCTEDIIFTLEAQMADFNMMRNVANLEDLL